MIIKNKDQERAKGYTTFSNEIHYNKDLTLNAKYLLIFLLSLPTTYDISVKRLVEMTGEGKAKIDSALKELKAQGYLEMSQIREGGRLTTKTKTVVYEIPELNPKFNPQINENVDITTFPPFSDFQESEKQKSENRVTYNNNSLKKENLKEKNKIISPTASETEKSKSKTKKPLPGNPKKNPSVEGKASKLADLFNETGGMGEATAESMPDVSTMPPVPAMTTSSLKAERIVKAILKEYSHLDFEVLEKSIQLAFEKEISDTKSFIAYVLTILSDWNCHGFTTIDKVEKYLKRISNTTPDLTLKPYRRVEMKPDWLANLDNIVPYDPNRKFNLEEKKKIDHMKQLQSQLLDFKAIDEAEANLPF